MSRFLDVNNCVMGCRGRARMLIGTIGFTNTVPICFKFGICMINSTSDEQIFVQAAAKRKKKKKKVRQTAAVEFHILPQNLFSFSLLFVQERPLEME